MPPSATVNNQVNDVGVKGESAYTFLNEVSVSELADLMSTKKMGVAVYFKNNDIKYKIDFEGTIVMSVCLNCVFKIGSNDPKFSPQIAIALGQLDPKEYETLLLYSTKKGDIWHEYATANKIRLTTHDAINQQNYNVTFDPVTGDKIMFKNGKGPSSMYMNITLSFGNTPSFFDMRKAGDTTLPLDERIAHFDIGQSTPITFEDHNSFCEHFGTNQYFCGTICIGVSRVYVNKTMVTLKFTAPKIFIEKNSGGAQKNNNINIVSNMSPAMRKLVEANETANQLPGGFNRRSVIPNNMAVSVSNTKAVTYDPAGTMPTVVNKIGKVSNIKM